VPGAAAHIPQPEVNRFVVLPDGERPIRADFVWRAQRLVVETDGHGTHRTWQAFERDRRNDRRLTVAGWCPIRITWRQLEREPEAIAAAVVALLRP
jgi:very-short-patch-repair endonuclease